LNKRINDFEFNTSPYFIRAKIFERRAQYRAALSDYDRGLEMAFEGNLSSLTDYYAYHAKRAYMHLKLGNSKNAVDDIDKALEKSQLTPDNILSRIPLSEIVNSDEVFQQGILEVIEKRVMHNNPTVASAIAVSELYAALGKPEVRNGVTTLTFRQGSAGYVGAVDTYIGQRFNGTAPNGPQGTAPILKVDGDVIVGNVELEQQQALLRFDGVFGESPRQIPTKADIISAELIVSIEDSGHHVRLHRMRKNWSDIATWQSLDNGVSSDEVEAYATHDAATGTDPIELISRGRILELNVLPSLNAWKDSPDSNFGWAILPIDGGTDSLQFPSSENENVSQRPLLRVTFTLPDAAKETEAAQK
jgi:hypothetical protein